MDKKRETPSPAFNSSGYQTPFPPAPTTCLTRAYRSTHPSALAGSSSLSRRATALNHHHARTHIHWPNNNVQYRKAFQAYKEHDRAMFAERITSHLLRVLVSKTGFTLAGCNQICHAGHYPVGDIVLSCSLPVTRETVP